MSRNCLITGAPALQGTSLHQVFLEEYLGGGVDNVEFLLEMMADDLRHRLIQKTRD